jgi:hypothetical protein
LFSANGSLRAVVPGGQGLQALRPAEVQYDPIGPHKGLDEDDEPVDPTAYPLDTLTKLHAVEVIGSAEVVGGFPYVVLEKTDGTFEHHWLTETGKIDDATDPVETQVELPFNPGKTLSKVEGKLVADDPGSGVLRFCATSTSPRDWTTPRDAGFLAVGQYAAGARQITATGIFNRRLAVFFQDSIQIWNMAADPSRITLENTLNGPGTEAPGSVENMLGDLVYFSQGGFRALSVVDLAGQTREGDIGSFIQAETDDIDLTTVMVAGFWSQNRSQYICAFGTTVYVFTNAVISKTRGWTKWELPITVEYMVEHEGEIYIRSENVLYKLAPNVVKDHGDVDVNWVFQPQFLDAKSPGVNKRWAFVNMVMSGSAHLDFFYDSRDLDLFVSGPDLSNTTYQIGLTPVMIIAEHIMPKFSGTGLFEFDALNLTFDVLRNGV